MYPPGGCRTAGAAAGGAGCASFLNFSHYDIDIEFSNVAVENVYIADSLMTLSYRAAALEEEQE